MNRAPPVRHPTQARFVVIVCASGVPLPIDFRVRAFLREAPHAIFGPCVLQIGMHGSSAPLRAIVVSLYIKLRPVSGSTTFVLNSQANEY
jgi:hypothetical protein